MLDPAIDDVRGLDTILYRIECTGDLRNHPSGDSAILDHAIDLLRSDVVYNVAILVQHTGDVGHQHQLFRAQCLCQLAGDQIGVDVVSFTFVTDADGRDHRDKVARVQ